MYLPTDTRTAWWSTPHGWGSFQPNGRKRVAGMGYQRNKKTWEAGAETWSARLFVGFNVGAETVWDMPDLIDTVRRVREQQTGDPSSSFVYQRGIYRHRSGEVVEEPGAQVIIINTSGATPAEWEEQMVALGESIADDLDQEEVVVELQRNGIVQRVFGVSA
jgi:hypothetical protein